MGKTFSYKINGNFFYPNKAVFCIDFKMILLEIQQVFLNPLKTLNSLSSKETIFLVF